MGEHLGTEVDEKAEAGTGATLPIFIQPTPPQDAAGDNSAMQAGISDAIAAAEPAKDELTEGADIKTEAGDVCATLPDFIYPTGETKADRDE